MPSVRSLYHMLAQPHTGHAGHMTEHAMPEHPVTFREVLERSKRDRTHPVPTNRTLPVSGPPLCSIARRWTVRQVGLVPGRTKVWSAWLCSPYLELPTEHVRSSRGQRPVHGGEPLLFSSFIPCANVLTPPSFQHLCTWVSISQTYF
jgi:hypothetical protein